MQLGPLLGALVGFTFVMAAAYAGTLRALEVYFDPERNSIFLSDDHESPWSGSSRGSANEDH